jgi:hypothetical protein
MDLPKASKIIFSVMFFIPVFGGIYYVNSQTRWPNSVFEVNTYLDQRRDAPIYDWDQARASVKAKKDKEKKSIILWVTSSFIVLLIAGYGVKKIEHKNNPKEILARLRKKGVIDEKEHQQKLSSIVEKEESKRLSKAIRRERNDLQKLKRKGVISKTDYEEKLSDLSDKFSVSRQESAENQKNSPEKKATNSDLHKILPLVIPSGFVFFNIMLLNQESPESLPFDPREEFVFPSDLEDVIEYGYNFYDLSEFMVYAVIPVFLFWGLKYVIRDKKPLEGTLLD